MGEIVEMDSKGRIVIPKQVREEMGLEKGSKLAVEIDGSHIVLFLGETKDLAEIKEDDEPNLKGFLSNR